MGTPPQLASSYFYTTHRADAAALSGDKTPVNHIQMLLFKRAGLESRRGQYCACERHAKNSPIISLGYARLTRISALSSNKIEDS
jgi:hypothetical protein